MKWHVHWTKLICTKNQFLFSQIYVCSNTIYEKNDPTSFDRALNKIIKIICRRDVFASPYDFENCKYSTFSGQSKDVVPTLNTHKNILIPNRQVHESPHLRVGIGESVSSRSTLKFQRPGERSWPVIWRHRVAVKMTSVLSLLSSSSSSKSKKSKKFCPCI